MARAGIWVSRKASAGGAGLTDDELRASPVVVTALTALVPAEYNSIDLSYTGENLTSVVYKQGATTVATLTLGYTGTNLTSVVRT